MRICVILEGCYPYVTGGVSTWIHQYMKAMPQHEFVIWAIGADAEQRGKYKYELPENVVGIHEIFLDEALRMPFVKGTYKFDQDELKALRECVNCGRPDWELLFRMYHDRKVSPIAFLMSQDFLEILTTICREEYPYTSFSDLFHTIRSMLLPLLLSLIHIFHRSIIMDEDTTESRVVPLEEAFVINEPTTRRELMMEIMYGNPNDYVKQLKEARLNDDTEVVHYAVTALTELQKDYDLKFQELDWKMEKNPKDEKILDDYLELLNRYLGSGIPEGMERTVKLRTYSNMLEKKLNEVGDDLSLLRRKAEVDLQIGEYEVVNEEIGKILELWGKNEAGYLLLLKYYSAIRNREGIDRTMETIERKRIHLSPEGRQAVRFWQKKQGV